MCCPYKGKENCLPLTLPFLLPTVKYVLYFSRWYLTSSTNYQLGQSRTLAESPLCSWISLCNWNCTLNPKGCFLRKLSWPLSDSKKSWQHLRVGQTPAASGGRRIHRAAETNDIFRQAVSCKGLFVHSRDGEGKLKTLNLAHFCWTECLYSAPRVSK